VSTNLARETINISSVYSNGEHGSKGIPCMACHKPHGGNFLIMPDSVDWNIDGGAPFSTKDASRTLTVSTITVTSINGIQNFCFATCHKNDTFDNAHGNGPTGAINYGTATCIDCHYHGGNRF